MVAKSVARPVGLFGRLRCCVVGLGFVPAILVPPDSPMFSDWALLSFVGRRSCIMYSGSSFGGFMAPGVSFLLRKAFRGGLFVLAIYWGFSALKWGVSRARVSVAGKVAHIVQSPEVVARNGIPRPLLLGVIRELVSSQEEFRSRSGISSQYQACVDASAQDPCPGLPFLAPPGVRYSLYPGRNLSVGWYGSVRRADPPGGLEALCVNVGDTSAVAPAGFTNSAESGDPYRCSVGY